MGRTGTAPPRYRKQQTFEIENAKQRKDEANRELSCMVTPLDAQHLMAENIPNACLETFDGVGHNMKVEIPDILAGTVMDFIRKVETD